MRTLNIVRSACLAGVLAVATPYAARADGISPAQFDILHRELASATEPWQTLPWELSLIEARSRAAKEKLPIYMLCRSGHPLACV